MRNPDRIPEILDLLHKLWVRYPDTRFNQLIHILQREYPYKGTVHINEVWQKIEQKNMVTYVLHTNPDLFYLEDDLFIEFLKKKVSELK